MRGGDAVGDEEAASSTLLGGVVDEVVGLAGHALQVGFVELVAGRVVALQAGADVLAGQAVGHGTRHALVVAGVQEVLGSFVALGTSFQTRAVQTRSHGAQLALEVGGVDVVVFGGVAEFAES